MDANQEKQMSLIRSEMEKVAVYWKSQKYKGSQGIVMDNYKPTNWITKEIHS